jgi:hypothetical protein
MSPLDGTQTAELADALCAEFPSEARLERLVLVTLNLGLFTDLVADGLPLRETAFKLVVALEQQGLTAPLVRGALRMSGGSPRLVAFCKHVAPELLAASVPAAEQVAAVVGGLNSLRARLAADPHLRARVIASRGQLEQIGDRIQRLDLYKRLHDGLHMIQVSYYRQVVDAARRFTTDPTAADTLDEYLTGLSTLCAQARATAGAFPTDDPGLRDLELRWVNALDADVIANLRLALKTRDAVPARKAVLRLKTLLTLESARINHALTEVARQLPLKELIDALGRVAESARGDDRDGKPLTDGLAGLTQLYPRLIGHIAVHTQWQRAENELWLADDCLDRATPEGQEEFALLWPAVRDNVGALIELDRDADWAKDLGQRAADLDAALAGTDALRHREGFRRYRRQAMLRFFQVDLNLRELCGAIGAIGEPVTALLWEAYHAND